MSIARLPGMLCLLACLGCATTPYRYGSFHPASEPRSPLVIEADGPHESLDRIEEVIHWPARVIPFAPQPKPRELSPETQAKLTAYLEKNDLQDVYVAVRQYNPSDQWQRLQANELISPGWRYSVGALSVMQYTLLPGRLLGSNRYNPYTNTLHVNSDVPAGILYAAAYAKDVHGRKLPGTYAAVNSLPVLSLGRQARAAGDVLGYARTEADWNVEKEAYLVLYPEIAASMASLGGPFVPALASPLLRMGGAAVGHTAARTMAARREKELAPEDLKKDDPLSNPDHSESKLQLVGYEE
ncbi:MAG: hypothetical protein ACKV0T_06385 [Planctomycetales bacterium]